MPEQDYINHTSDIWYRLDNAATIFPVVSDDWNTNVFRLDCTLTSPVDPDVLQVAVKRALADFPAFSVVLRRGLFWYYLERTDQVPQVLYENERPCSRIFRVWLKEPLFRVSWYQNRINLEVFHALSDGTGAFQFLYSMVYHYLMLSHGDLPVDLLPPGNEPPPEQQAADSFSHYYNTENAEKSSLFRGPAWRIGGTLLARDNISVITVTLKTGQMLELARNASATVTAYLTSLLIVSIYHELMPRRAHSRDIRVTVPVDLRGHFASETTRNFFSVATAGYNFSGQDDSFEAVLESVSRQLTEQVNAGALEKRINYTMSIQDNIASRFVPLALKKPILRAAYKRAERATTCALSNIGQVKMPAALQPFITGFSGILNPTNHHRLKACVCSYGDRFTINFTSVISETRAQKYFVRYLTERGLEVVISSNRFDENQTS